MFMEPEEEDEQQDIMRPLLILDSVEKRRGGDQQQQQPPPCHKKIRSEVGGVSACNCYCFFLSVISLPSLSTNSFIWFPIIHFGYSCFLPLPLFQLPLSLCLLVMLATVMMMMMMMMLMFVSLSGPGSYDIHDSREFAHRHNTALWWDGAISRRVFTGPPGVGGGGSRGGSGRNQGEGRADVFDASTTATMKGNS